MKDFTEHTCEECPYWDDINGCWAGHSVGQWGPNEMACPDYDGDDYDDEDDYGDDNLDGYYNDEPSAPAEKPKESANGH
jgi:hypothetical protein